MSQPVSIAAIKTLYPDEWVLVGDPVMDESRLEVTAGVPLFHSKDKKEVCYIGREKTAGFAKITIIYTGTHRASRKITGIFNRVVQASARGREEQIDTDARRVARYVARCVRLAGTRISQADIDQEEEAVRSRQYAAGHH